MNRVDEILAIIDTGLQTAGDMAYGTDWPGTCWRCGKEVDTDLCDKCRTVLLDETTTAADIIDGLITLDVDVDQFIEHLDALIAGFADLPLDMRRAIAQGVLDDLPTTTNQGATRECSTNPTTT